MQRYQVAAIVVTLAHLASCKYILGIPDEVHVIDAGTDTADAFTCTEKTLRRQLTFSNANRSQALVDFPVLVRLDDGVNLDFSNAAPGGADVRFTDANGQLLAHEIEQWSDSGPAFIWVRVPEIRASSDRDFIWMYYGDEAAGPPPPTDVWRNGFVGVWHLTDESTGQTQRFDDSSANANHATATGGQRPVAAPQGHSAGAVEFDGANDAATVTDHASLRLVSMSLEAWVYIPGQLPGEFQVLLEHGRNSDNWYGLWLSNAGDVFHYRWSNTGSHIADFSTVILPDRWYYVVGTYDATSTTARGYVNGGLEFEDPSGGAGTPRSSDLRLGRSLGGFEEFDGYMDEVRLSNVARSEHWVSAQYASMKNTFITFGPEQSASDCAE